MGTAWEAAQGSVEDRLVEEAAEVIQAVMKGARFGWDNTHPNTKVGNRQRAVAEMEDLVLRWNELAEQENLPTYTQVPRHKNRDDEGRQLEPDYPIAAFLGAGQALRQLSEPDEMAPPADEERSP